MKPVSVTLPPRLQVYVARLARRGNCDEGEVVRGIIQYYMDRSNPPLPAAQMAERQQIIDALWAAHGNISEAARSMGAWRRTIQRQIKKYSITPDEYLIDTVLK